jgi:hypothetical protein
MALRVPIPQQLAKARVDYAQISFPAFLPKDYDGRVTTLVYQVQTAWDPALTTWTSPWRVPGGDLDSLWESRFVTSAEDGHPIQLDITRAVKLWQETGRNFGVILKRPDAEGGGYKLEAKRLREALKKARVKFYFTQMRR